MHTYSLGEWLIPKLLSGGEEQLNSILEIVLGHIKSYNQGPIPDYRKKRKACFSNCPRNNISHNSHGSTSSLHLKPNCPFTSFPMSSRYTTETNMHRLPRWKVSMLFIRCFLYNTPNRHVWQSGVMTLYLLVGKILSPKYLDPTHPSKWSFLIHTLMLLCFPWFKKLPIFFKRAKHIN